MDEFVDRMAMQRHVLDVVNRQVDVTEKLFGLSSNAIERWMLANGFSPSSKVVSLLKEISAELFFIATQSQEPVSAEYKTRRQKIGKWIKDLENVVEHGGIRES